ncbi:MAG: hypothetical protein IPM47_13800 [Sphingobacteriales bacterium]|nr:MAG: hypothetical protein IPM47_13800 [Sphingobacteriales bacterium]
MKTILNKTIFYMFLLLGFYSIKSLAQECEPYFPMNVGTKIEMTNYDAKGKNEGKNVIEILEQTPIEGGISAKVKSIIYDKKDKETYNTTYDIKCVDGIFYMDFKNFIPAESNEMFKGMEANIETDWLEFPTTLTVGQTLPDGEMTVNMNSNGLALFSMTINVSNRQVLAQESITTPAGTFECFKISQETTLRTIMNITSKSISWYAKNVGSVRNENYDRKGKLLGYSEITSYQE